MDCIADLHIHSRFSRATSKTLDFVSLHRAALEKGITLVGTGDFTHPGWMAEIEAQLEPAEPGLFRLKPDLARQTMEALPRACTSGTVRFVLQVEISNIYKKEDRVRKNHNLVYVPDLEAARRFTESLEAIGNVRSDGRPILGLDARDLLEITLETSPSAFLVPAHIWTPWFSMLGSKSGFDSLEACFGDLSGHIFAAETGLSSDPPMNWRVSSLDRLTLVSNSDAHSAANLGREANLLDIDLSFESLRRALETREGYHGTLEFYPEEGKYHLDGHRKCNIRLSPEETRALGGRCPVCGGKLTVGVMSRVLDLADRPAGARSPHAGPFSHLVPLAEVVSESIGVGPSSKRVAGVVRRLLERLGPELSILREVPVEEISALEGPVLAEAVRRARHGEVVLHAGYDGAYGVVRLFEPEERDRFAGQLSLTGAGPNRRHPRRSSGPTTEPSTSAQPSLFDPSARGSAPAPSSAPSPGRAEPRPAPTSPPAHSSAPEPVTPWLEGLNDAQRAAAQASSGPLLIVAGPGTGKTRTLVSRIVHLIQTHTVTPDEVLAIAFTRQAAGELRDRLQAALPAGAPSPMVTTFHGFGQWILAQAGAATDTILDDDQRREAIRNALGASVTRREAQGLARLFSLAKQSPDPEAVLDTLTRAEPPPIAADANAAPAGAPADDSTEAPWETGRAVVPAGLTSEGISLVEAFARYQAHLRATRSLDVDDLVLEAYRALDDPEVARRIAGRFASVSVDEFQDVNDVQAALIQRLWPGGEALCAIGDPDQAIYGFRGSRPGHFLRFSQTWPGSRVVRLRTTYRLTRPVLDVAHSLLPGEPALVALKDGPRVEVVACPTPESEAEQVLVRIEKIIGGSSYFAVDSGRGDEAEDLAAGFGDIAVLTRTKTQQQALAKALGRSAIPCRLIAADEPHDPRSEKVAVMTMHAAKGREFQVVFVTGVERGLVPLTVQGFQTDPNEERRLLYVAITRARRLAVISHAARRTLFGRSLPGGPSPFLASLPERALRRTVPTLPKRNAPSPQLDLFSR